MALAHNGNLVNSAELREQLEMEGSIFHSTSDTEVISYIITKERINSPSIEEALNRAMNKIKGAYSLVVMSPSKLIAARDENGFRPLCYGVTDDGTYIIASESCALDSVGASFIRDVKPGEIVVFDKDGIHSITDHCNKVKPTMCIFEYIYFARPDSVMEGKSVHMARIKAGACLAMEHPVEADVVVGVPDSGLPSAMGYALESGIPYCNGIVKNRYVGRTFIQPTDEMRQLGIRLKLNPLPSVISGQRLVVIDDSIVRGNTSKKLVDMLRSAGAKEVHLRIVSPETRWPCFYGIDTDTHDQLIAANMTNQEMCDFIGCDSLAFISVEGLHEAIQCEHPGFCDACFTGEYPVDIPDTMKAKSFLPEGKAVLD